MSFITYAQNFEDVLLWRALGHVKNGFYIDVGANDPVLHSVTKAFYDAGWSGINIEPMPSYLQVFGRERPRDINLGLAAGAADGEITLFDIPDVNGWATTDRDVAEAHLAEGHALVEHTVPLRTLNAICAEHVDRPIHFLKIDVEGFEGEVLRGLDLDRWRPWVLVVEATLPGSRATNHETWEALVTGHAYHYAYFDGLNRYYVADEQRQLLDVLNLQANVFDDYLSYHLDQAWKDIKTMTGVAEQAQQAHADAAATAAHAEARRAEAEAARQAAMQRAEQAVADSLQANEQIRQSQARADEAVWRADNAIASVNAMLAATEAVQARAAENAAQRDQAQQRAEQAIAASLQAVEQGRAALAQRDAEARAAETALRGEVTAINAAMLAQVAAAEQERQALLIAADREKQALLVAADQEKQALLTTAGQEKQALLAEAGQQAAAAAANEAALRQRQAELEQQLAEVHFHAHNIDTARHQLAQWAGDMQQRLIGIEASWTWRMTNPLRRVASLLRRGAPALGAVPRALKARSTHGARLVLRRLSTNESTRRLLMPLKTRFPDAAERVLKISRHNPLAAHAVQAQAAARQTPDPHLPQALHEAMGNGAAAHPALAADLSALPQSVRGVLADLVVAMQSTSR